MNVPSVTFVAPDPHNGHDQLLLGLCAAPEPRQFNKPGKRPGGSTARPICSRVVSRQAGSRGVDAMASLSPSPPAVACIRPAPRPRCRSRPARRRSREYPKGEGAMTCSDRSCDRMCLGKALRLRRRPPPPVRSSTTCSALMSRSAEPGPAGSRYFLQHKYRLSRRIPLSVFKSLQ